MNNNNDVLRSLRYTFNFDDAKMMKLASDPETSISRTDISNWLKQDDHPDYEECNDLRAAIFLNSFIEEKRGKKDGPAFEPETQLNNNIIFRKLKIALDLKEDDIIELLDLANYEISKHEISALLRKSSHKNYRTCKSQLLRNFLKGIQLKFRPEE